VKPALLSYLSLAGGILALSLSPLYIRWAQAPGIVTSLFRMTTAGVVLAPLALRQLARDGRFPGWKPILVGLLGGVMTSGDHAFWSTALAFTSVANATLFNYIAPLWVALFAALVWREKLSLPFWGGLVLVLGGMTAVTGANLENGFSLKLGDLLGVCSRLFYAGYFLVSQRGRGLMPTLPYIWLVAVGAAGSLLAICLASGQPLSGFSPQTYLVFLLAGLFSQVGGYFLVAYALGHLPAVVVAPSMIAQPVISALLAIPVAGEMLSPGQVVGGIAILAGIAVVNRAKGRG
jgi:drug/metabolite transporter (DMT)-like permease